MDVRRHLYAVDGWGVGELYVRDGVVLAHELPQPRASATDGKVPADDRARLTVGPAAPVGPATPKGGVTPPEVTLAVAGARVRDEFVPDLVVELVARVRRHLAGEAAEYGDVRLDLSWCTPFQAELARAVRAVAWGEVVSYGELAALAGRPGAARAAGSFCAQNRFALLLPCHRVVARDGIGGYGESGVPVKRRLLALEGVRL